MIKKKAFHSSHVSIYIKLYYLLEEIKGGLILK